MARDCIHGSLERACVDCDAILFECLLDARDALVTELADALEDEVYSEHGTNAAVEKRLPLLARARAAVNGKR